MIKLTFVATVLSVLAACSSMSSGSDSMSSSGRINNTAGMGGPSATQNGSGQREALRARRYDAQKRYLSRSDIRCWRTPGPTSINGERHVTAALLTFKSDLSNDRKGSRTARHLEVAIDKFQPISGCATRQIDQPSWPVSSSKTWWSGLEGRSKAAMPPPGRSG